MTYVLWALLLILQNAAFTWVSRARNSGSIGYHAVASVASNGVWIASQFILVDAIVRIIRQGAWHEAIGMAVFYTACTVTGSVGMHWLSMHYLERGKRRVGA